MLLRKTRKVNLLIPNIAKHGGNDSETFEGYLFICLVLSYLFNVFFTLIIHYFFYSFVSLLA